ncbi:hypothetical protein [Mangrovicoccus sp. HB161399]|uniref:hypothetical protein n=1 Tax=Mangrovicoccus sp. HB161399 TaxID=2720392 RepID=UPI0015526066|nr:hypothetical protein [Mangrovicoccus sp. HB161399]
MTAPRIASCCYCGRQQALVLAGEARHELACSGCGAPLADLKALPRSHGGLPPKRPKPPPHRLPAPDAAKAAKKQRKRTRKLQKRLVRKAAGALFDLFD